MQITAPKIFSYRKFWPHKFGAAPVLPMSRDEMDDLGWDSCDIIIVTGVVCGLVYFFFSKAHTGVVGGAANVGITLLMVAFGASFGYTVMARISLLIGQTQFLLFEWLPTMGINL